MSDAITNKSRGYGLTVFAILLLALIAIAASGYLFYMGLRFKNNFQTELSLLQKQNLALNSQLQQSQQQVFQLQNTTVGIQNRLNQLSDNKTNVVVFQINELISLANQALVVYHDVNAAIRLLNYALDILNGNSLALFTELKVALTTDLEKLKQLPVIDSVIMTTKLDNIIIETTQLHIANQNVLPNPVQSSSNQNNWHKFITNVKSVLVQLVQVTKTNNNTKIILLPEEEVIVRQNVKLDLLNARMALLQRDNTNWQFSLKRAEQNIQIYFLSDAVKKNIEIQLGELANTDIDAALSNIDATLAALNKLNNLN